MAIRVKCDRARRRRMSQSTAMDEPARRCHVTMDAAPGMEHASDCRERHAAKRDGLDESFKRDCVRRMVALLKEAGGPLGEWDIYRRLERNGGVRDWPDVYAMALEEGLVERRNDIMFDLPIKLPKVSPEELAEHDAFLKAQRLGVVARSEEGFFLTDRRHDGLLTQDETDMAAVYVAVCNSIGTAEVKRMRRRFTSGEIPYAEYRKFADGVCARARKLAQKAQSRA